MGVGDAYPRPSELSRSLREARLALRMQKASASAERTSVFADLDVLRMLAAVDDLTDVEAFVRKWLGTLAAYDERKHTELVKTLIQYLQHGGGYEATSRALSVHRSTLKYRLQRIRELTGFDLGESRDSLQPATRDPGLRDPAGPAEIPRAEPACLQARRSVGPARTRPGVGATVAS